jgi:hypothetical protein
MFYLFCAQSEIIQANRMQEVCSYLKEADSNTLVIFDVDMVLVQPNDPAFQMANMKRHHAIAKKIMKEMSPEKQVIFLSLMTLKSEPLLLDAQIPQLLDQLNQRGIPSMALTANLTGEFAYIKNMEKWRVNSLRQVGIDFSQTAPYQQSFIFSHLPSFRGNYSTYLEGILFVNGTSCSKGEALLAFLQQARLSPQKIVFIDDREDNLKSVADALEGKSIDYQAFHFVGAKDYPSQILTEEQFESRWQELAKEAEGLN